jgi:Icc-related predicted phosphoesterase
MSDAADGRRDIRILACADLHGRPDRIARVRTLVSEHHPDVLLLPGDLTHAGRGEEALDLLRTLPIPVLAVAGNMDGARALEVIARQGGLAGPTPLTVAGITFGGPDVADACDVLVTHEPPRGVLDLAVDGRHAGSERVREMVMRLRPRVHTFGHIHESPGIARLGETLAVNCTMGDGTTGGALIELSATGANAAML